MTSNLLAIDKPLTEADMLERKRAKRRLAETPRGYYAPPGTGPEGEMCWTCKHRALVEYASRYWKCDKNRANWTRGPKTDIRLKSPACKGWEEQ